MFLQEEKIKFIHSMLDSIPYNSAEVLLNNFIMVYCPDNSLKFDQIIRDYIKVIFSLLIIINIFILCNMIMSKMSSSIRALIRPPIFPPIIYCKKYVFRSNNLHF